MDLSKLTLEERIFLLESMLHQAQHKIDFLHNCLVNPAPKEWKEGGGCQGYSYGHPEQTIRFLERCKQIAEPPKLCFHSRRTEGCEQCVDSHERYVKLFKIEEKADIK